jgi:hypothetical protein
MFRVQSIAQSGGRRIAASVKTLVDFSGRNIGPGTAISPVKSKLSIGRLNRRAVLPEKPTSNNLAMRV